MRPLAFALLAFSVVSLPPARLHAAAVQAAAAKTNIDDTWQGTLHAEKDFRTVIKISKDADGKLKTQFFSIDQGGRPIPVDTTTFQGGQLVLKIDAIDGLYSGTLSPDGTTITGQMKQGDKPLPMIFVRATPDTAWAIPEPPKAVPPMAADANPSWDVATIKPAPPDEQGKGFGGPPRHFQTRNTTLNDMIAFAYDVNPKQIVGGPDWMGTDKFDIVTGEPDVPGNPTGTQVKGMLRKLMAQRFGMKFHEGKQQMSAYVLTVAKDGVKMTKTDGDEHSGGGFQFTKLGHLIMRNQTMDDICHGFQGAVFDRPVVNHTGLQGRYNGTLTWTPDETQFAVFNVKIVPDESPDAPPPIFTAIQQQSGLKLDAEKTAVDVMILDHVEKPSEN
ncbi:TIGR03435 family protein [Terriglobus roseus]|uniref:Soil-associated protein, TIGR03435 family n=1 Tax=Terriglobus roseus TaxID=392734 RepID=A0A1G7FM58_9BACT|nr:TIGR03435 family protein [Terriglobus roseus]SDE77027.1 soil-associated protein, TIGR03435 family [Terriglobus roseus]